MSAELKRRVAEAAPRVAELGNWPSWINAVESLASRVPEDGRTAPGFDAGIACALDLIPRMLQRLPAILHAAYTFEAIEQVRREMEEGNPDSETLWWLAACSVCREGKIDVTAFAEQLDEFHRLATDRRARELAASSEMLAMAERFRVIDGIPFVIHDGGLQGAYIHGYDWGVQYDDEHGIFFIGTFRPSLGLEDFPFSDRKDSEDRPMSGPVHGSKQFVKASSFAELAAALVVVQQHLGPPKK